MTEHTQVEIDRLLRSIRGHFYAGASDKRFFQDRNSLLYALTWPADWLRYRGVTWPAERYFRTLDELFAGIREHGATGEIRYFPGYLLKVIQDHFAHHSDEYCDEARRTRHAFDLALGRALDATRQPRPSSGRDTAAQDTITILAAAHRVLAHRRRKPAPARDPKSDATQAELFKI